MSAYDDLPDRKPKPAWLEDWEADKAGGQVLSGDENTGCVILHVHWASPKERKKADVTLAAAAPALVRALLLVEWGACDSQFTDEPACPGCVGVGEHETGCSVDAALTLAGFPDAASRDAARAELKARAK